jgi:hypothetical protein
MQCLKGYINPDVVSAFKAVSDGFRDVVDFDDLAPNSVGFDSLSERCSRIPDKVKRWIVDFWSPRLIRQRQPNFGR